MFAFLQRRSCSGQPVLPRHRLALSSWGPQCQWLWNRAQLTSFLVPQVPHSFTSFMFLTWNVSDLIRQANFRFVLSIMTRCPDSDTELSNKKEK